MEKNTSRSESVQGASEEIRTAWQEKLFNMFIVGLNSLIFSTITNTLNDESYNNIIGLKGTAVPNIFELVRFVESQGREAIYQVDTDDRQFLTIIYNDRYNNAIIDVAFADHINDAAKTHILLTAPWLICGKDTQYALSVRNYNEDKAWKSLRSEIQGNLGFLPRLVYNGKVREEWPVAGTEFRSSTPFHIHLSSVHNDAFAAIVDIDEAGTLCLREDYLESTFEGRRKGLKKAITDFNYEIATLISEPNDPHHNAVCSRKDAQDAAAINSLCSVVFEAVDSGFVNNFGVVSYDGQWLEKNYDPNEGTLYSYCQELHNHANGFGTIIGYLDDSPVFSFVYSPQSDRKILSFSRLCYESDGNYTVPARLKDAYKWASRYDNGKSHILQFNSHSVEDWKYLSAQLTRRGLTDKIYVRSGYDRLSLSSIIRDMETTVGRSITSSPTVTLPLVKEGELIAILEFGESGELFIADNYTDSEETLHWLTQEVLPKFNGGNDYSQVLERTCRCLCELVPNAEWVDVITGTIQPHTVYSKDGGIVKVDTKFDRSPYDLDLYIVYSRDGVGNAYAPCLFTMSGDKNPDVQVYGLGNQRTWNNKAQVDPRVKESLEHSTANNWERLDRISPYTDHTLKSDFDYEFNPLGFLRKSLDGLMEDDYSIFFIGSRFKLHNLSAGYKNFRLACDNPNFILIRRGEKVIGMLSINSENLDLSLVGSYWADRKFNIRKWIADVNTNMKNRGSHFKGSTNTAARAEIINPTLPDPKIIQNRARDMANSVMAFWNNSKFDDSINLAVEVVVEYLSYATLLNQTPEYDTRYWNAGFWTKVVSGEEKLVRTGPVHDELMHRVENTFVDNAEFHKRMEAATPTVTIFLAKINDIARFFLPIEG